MANGLKIAFGDRDRNVHSPTRRGQLDFKFGSFLFYVPYQNSPKCQIKPIFPTVYAWGIISTLGEHLVKEIATQKSHEQDV